MSLFDVENWRLLKQFPPNLYFFIKCDVKKEKERNNWEQALLSAAL